MVSNPRLIPWQPPPSWAGATDANEVRPLGPVPGDPARSALAGGVAGVLGAWLAFAIAEGIEDRARLVAYLRVAVGQGSSAAVSSAAASPATVWLAIALVGVLGLLPGAGLGWLMRRLHGAVARVVFGAVLVPSVWIAIDAFGLLRFAPRLADLVPFVPWLAGAVAYGVSVALAGPIAPRLAPTASDPLDDILSLSRGGSVRPPVSFPLLRRKAS
jgi:hypothetical protein